MGWCLDISRAPVDRLPHRTMQSVGAVALEYRSPVGHKACLSWGHPTSDPPEASCSLVSSSPFSLPLPPSPLLPPRGRHARSTAAPVLGARCRGDTGNAAGVTGERPRDPAHCAAERGHGAAHRAGPACLQWPGGGEGRSRRVAAHQSAHTALAHAQAGHRPPHGAHGCGRTRESLGADRRHPPRQRSTSAAMKRAMPTASVPGCTAPGSSV